MKRELPAPQPHDWVIREWFGPVSNLSLGMTNHFWTESQVRKAAHRGSTLSPPHPSHSGALSSKAGLCHVILVKAGLLESIAPVYFCA